VLNGFKGRFRNAIRSTWDAGHPWQRGASIWPVYTPADAIVLIAKAWVLKPLILIFLTMEAIRLGKLF
jgi:hypothetical protein